MVERVMEQQVPICATLIEMKRMDLLPKDTECRLLEGVWKVLKPFKDVTVQVSAVKYVTTSAIQPLIHHLTQKALRVEDADSLAIKSMKQEMAKNLQSRYQEPAVKELLDFVCFVDPRFKSMPFLDHHESIPSYNVDTCTVLGRADQAHHHHPCPSHIGFRHLPSSLQDTVTLNRKLSCVIVHQTVDDAYTSWLSMFAHLTLVCPTASVVATLCHGTVLDVSQAEVVL